MIRIVGWRIDAIGGGGGGEGSVKIFSLRMRALSGYFMIPEALHNQIRSNYGDVMMTMMIAFFRFVYCIQSNWRENKPYIIV